MTFRVCIPCAGIGARLGEATRYINKSLVAIANRPTLAHQIEQFPIDAEFVIALGYKGHLVREFLELAYPERRFFFAEVSSFEGPGSGLGLSLLACREHLQLPFIFISCDTLVDEPIPAPESNWMGYAEAVNLNSYRTVQLQEGRVQLIAEKGRGDPSTHRAYIGLAGIQDYKVFWDAMVAGGADAIDSGEAFGLRHLIERGVEANCFTWHDTGNVQALAETRSHFREPDEPNILEKANEAIWFVDDKVIKFSDDERFITNRIQRVEQIGDFVPQIIGSRDHMYCYRKVAGRVLSERANLPKLHGLLKYCQTFWRKESLTSVEADVFHERCMSFYRKKTLERVAQFYNTFGRVDGCEAINGVAMPSLSELLERVDWVWLADGMAGRFHGDFHFENILLTPDEKFVFLDWRQDFAGDVAVGDIYYDLAKLMHGLIISHELIARDLFSVDWREDAIEFDVHRKQSLVECERFFERWLVEQGYEVRRVRILTALIYLNIAALHHNPYCLLLYSIGKYMLHAELEG